MQLPAGNTELVMIIDFAETLPCLILEGGSLSTDDSWEVSLDRKTWQPAECESAFSDPDAAPDTCRDLIVVIDP